MPLIVRVSEKHRKMSLAGYDAYRFGGGELWVNDNNSEGDIIKYLGDFLTDYLKILYGMIKITLPVIMVRRVFE